MENEFKLVADWFNLFDSIDVRYVLLLNNKIILKGPNIHEKFIVALCNFFLLSSFSD